MSSVVWQATYMRLSRKVSGPNHCLFPLRNRSSISFKAYGIHCELTSISEHPYGAPPATLSTGGAPLTSTPIVGRNPSALGLPTWHAYSPQWTLFHASRSLTSPAGSGGGGSWPSLYNRAAFPHRTLARASGMRWPRSWAINWVAPGQIHALCG